MRSVALAALSCALAAAATAAAKTGLTGKEAAHVDWSVKNCAATSTDKEHRLVDLANAKGHDQFVARWMAESNKLAAAADTAAKRNSLCSDIKGWYGPQGSRIAGLITWKRNAAPSNSQVRSTGEAGGRRRGRKRQ